MWRKREYVCDALGRPLNTRTDIGNSSSPVGTGPTAPSTALGVNTVLWEALTVNARGQTELSRSANGVDNRASFEPQSGSPMSRSVELRYNALGMLLYKSDVGYYSYGAQATAGVQPHALKSVAFTGSLATPSTPAIAPITTLCGYDLNGNLKTANVGSTTTLAYTSFNLPDAQRGINGESTASASTQPRCT